MLDTACSCTVAPDLTRISLPALTVKGLAIIVTVTGTCTTLPAQGAGVKETFSFTVTGTSNGQAKSDSVNVVVQGVPDIAAHSNDVSVHAGATVNLAGSVTGAGTVEKLEWTQSSTGVSVGTITNASATGDIKYLNASFVAPSLTEKSWPASTLNGG